MSVILFAKEEVYQQMADAYEGLKEILSTCCSIDDDKFYKSLRRLYFANVATFLCQYHDDTRLPDSELLSIDGFTTLLGKKNVNTTNVEKINTFLSAWGSLKYNLVTNDGEKYIAQEGYEYIENVVFILSREVLLGVGK